MATKTSVSASLSENHWQSEWYAERMTTKQWRQVLLEGRDWIFFRGERRQLVAKRLGNGIVEVAKATAGGKGGAA